MKKSEYRIEAMDCPTEEQIIRNRLRGMDGVDELGFDLMSRVLTVEHRLETDEPIRKALNEIGMPPTDAEAEAPERSPWPERIRLAIGGILAISSEVAHWAEEARHKAIGEESHGWPVIVLALAAIAVVGLPILKKGFVALRTFTLNINFLMAIAVVCAAAIGQWPEAAMVIFLFAVAEAIEAHSLDRARNAIQGLMRMTPQHVLAKQDDSSWLEVSASSIALGATIRVRPGERIGLDGDVLSGHSSVNEAPITGESIPVDKEPGSHAYAGTINEHGSLELRVTAKHGDTTLDHVIRTLQKAQASRAPMQRFVDRFAAVYTPVVVLFAVLVALVPPLFFSGDWREWIYNALVLLVIACPCALVISTPVTVVSGLATAAKRGILIKGGAYLEAGRRLHAIALDKTGTLTLGKPELTDVVAFDSLSKDDALRIAASLDSRSEHPIAKAITRGYAGPLSEVSGFRNLPGRGVTGTIDGVGYTIGNHRLTEELGACGEQVEEVLFGLESQGKTAVVLAAEKKALAVLAVADGLRETSIEALRDLHSLGVRSLMLTGDNGATAHAIAEEAGIDVVHAELLPEDKLKIIEQLRKQPEFVGMVGDGVNDAPALAAADIGFAMGAAGTDTALETADVALMHDDLRKVPEFIRLSKRTGVVLAQNIAIAIGIKVVFFALALMGKATLWGAVFADMGASLIVVFNGLRLLRSGRS